LVVLNNLPTLADISSVVALRFDAAILVRPSMVFVNKEFLVLVSRLALAELQRIFQALSNKKLLISS